MQLVEFLRIHSAREEDSNQTVPVSSAIKPAVKTGSSPSPPNRPPKNSSPPKQFQSQMPPINLRSNQMDENPKSTGLKQIELQEHIKDKLSTRIVAQMNDSDEDVDALPSWMRDIQPYVAKKFDKVFTIYKKWQETQNKEQVIRFDKKFEEMETRIQYKHKQFENDLEFIKTETHGLCKMEMKFRQMGYLQ